VLRRSLPTWRGIVARLDLLRSTGPRHAWRSFRRDRALAAVAAARRRALSRNLWEEAARELGATLTEPAPGRLEIRRGSTATTVVGQTTRLNSGDSMRLAADKPGAYKRLAEAGLRIPEHESFEARDSSAARAFVARGPLPCVVKPATGTGGDGVTGNVRDAAELRRAVLAASRFAPRILIERQVPGDVFRLLVLDGEVIDVVQRLRPSITGDGHSTVEELIVAEYERRIRADDNPGLKPFAVDLDCLFSLKHGGVALGNVLPAGATLEIRTVTNYNRPSDNRTLADVSPELRADATAAAAALGLRLSGVDVVTPTPKTSLASAGGAVIDVNATPGLHHHTQVADPDSATRVAIPILRALLEPAERAQAAT
jgi:glutathione synthase/RimK-type ligase-like ATP-grasp enzyme